MYNTYRRLFYLVYKIAKKSPINTMPDLSADIGLTMSVVFYLAGFNKTVYALFGFRVFPEGYSNHSLLLIASISLLLILHHLLFVRGGRLAQIIEECSSEKVPLWKDRLLIFVVFFPYLALPAIMAFI
jgi:hypothetical protein